jgi:hypothetical protein
MCLLRRRPSPITGSAGRTDYDGKKDSMSKPETTSDPLLAEQIAYYRAIAPEYEDHAIAEPGADELAAALHLYTVAHHPTGMALVTQDPRRTLGEVKLPDTMTVRCPDSQDQL